ncbi:MAG: hypothetical protein NUK65_03070 [Firmicutes bacterium]|nr:hypothetical protein [Bacillota bacterium]
MKEEVVIGKFRSKDTATQAIQKLGEEGFMDVSFHQISATPSQGMDNLSNAYAGELPLFARGVLGSDIAIEGRSTDHLYNEEDAIKLMGKGSKVPSAYAVAVHIIDQQNRQHAQTILERHGADVELKEIEVDE